METLERDGTALRVSQMLDGVMPDVPSTPTLRDSNLLLSLLPLFNFDGQPRVSFAEWQRGVDSLGMDHLAHDERVWTQLTGIYGDGGATGLPLRDASVDLSAVMPLVPLDPHTLILFRALVSAIDHVKSFARAQTIRNDDFMRQNEVAMRKVAMQEEVRYGKLVLKHRREICLPPLEAWRDLTRQSRKIRKRAVQFVTYLFDAKARRAFNQWADLHAAMRRVQHYMQRWRRVDISLAFGAWEEVMSNLACLTRCLSHTQCTSCVLPAPSLRAYLHCVRTTCTVRAAQMRHTRRRMRRFVLKMLHAGQSRALERWVESGEEWRRMRQVVGRGIKCALPALSHTLALMLMRIMCMR